MKKKMININTNFLALPTFLSFENNGKEKAEGFEKGDLIYIFGYFKKCEKDGKIYKNFVVKSYNLIAGAKS
ncbi:MAG: hypothetical protein PUG43_00840 [Clostridiales bacterium]|nr:hypothetical protein [Clostridiales bacterium]